MHRLNNHPDTLRVGDCDADRRRHDNPALGRSSACGRRRAAVMALGLPIALMLGLGAASPGQAQERYPNRPIRIVVPFAAGGIADIYARVLGKSMGEQLGTTFVIENKPGAGTVIGTEAVVRSKPDGYTMLLASAPLATNPGLMAKLPYDTLKDLTPVVQLSSQGFVISVHEKTPYKTFADLVSAARQNDIPYASPGNGTLMHLVGQLLNLEYGTRFVHVPYRGSAPALQDATSGQIGMIIDPLSTSLPGIQQGKLRPLAVTHPDRLPALQAVPTLRELGYPKGEAQAFSGFLVPAGVPPEMVAVLNKAANQAMLQPDVRETIVVKLQSPLIGGTPEAYAQFLRAELARWVPLIKRVGIKPD